MAFRSSMPTRIVVWDIYCKRTDDDGNVHLSHHCRMDDLDKALSTKRRAARSEGQEYSLKTSYAHKPPLV